MRRRKRDAERSKAAIVAAARKLFAKRGIAAVSIRDIARAAGVSHGLVELYFGTRKRLIAAIIRSEIEDFQRQVLPSEAAADDILGELRKRLRAGMPGFRHYAMLITRAELAGFKPEELLDPTVSTPAMNLAKTIGELQAQAPSGVDRLDPRLVSAYINASLFAFAVMSPWLMTVVGLKPKDYEARFAEIAEISVRLIALASKTPAGQILQPESRNRRHCLA
jgi:AcrR family transcriptional regulator